MAEMQDYLGQVQEYTQPAREGVQQAGEAYTGMLKEGASLPDQLKQAVQQKLDYNKDLIQQQSGAAADYFAAPAEARAMYQDVHNPFEREKLVSQYRTQQLQPYSTLTDLLGQRMGNVSDIISSGVQGWQGMTDAARAGTQLAQQGYQNVLGEYGMGTDMYQQAQAREIQRAQMENQMKAEQARLALQKMLGLQDIGLQERQLGLQERGLGMEQEQAEWERPWQERLWEYQLNQPYYKPTGDGTTGDDWWDTGEGQTGGQPSGITEPKPTTTPSRTDIQYHSPEGQWVYNPGYGDWITPDEDNFLNALGG